MWLLLMNPVLADMLTFRGGGIGASSHHPPFYSLPHIPQNMALPIIFLKDEKEEKSKFYFSIFSKLRK